MATKSKRAMTPESENILNKILQHVKDLFEEHESEFMNVMDESEKKAIRVGFGCTIDCSESIGKVETGIRFSQVYTDVRTSELSDPKQHALLQKGPEGKELPAPKPKSEPAGDQAKEKVVPMPSAKK